MISMTWIYIMLLMLAGSFILQMVPGADMEESRQR